MENEDAPLMSDPAEKEVIEKDEEKNLDNCCNKNVAVIILVLIVVKIMLIVEMFKLFTISGNEHFDSCYLAVYLVLVILIAVVTVLLVLLIFEPSKT